jgi:hypothetical protein
MRRHLLFGGARARQRTDDPSNVVCKDGAGGEGALYAGGRALGIVGNPGEHISVPIRQESFKSMHVLCEYINKEESLLE